MAQQVLFGSGLCQSLRQLSQQWSAVLGSSVGLRTINERIHQMEPLLRQARSELIVDVPAVVQFDGIWLREQIQTDTVKLDKRGRKRKKRKGKKVVLLVALGLWTDGSGKREILDWQVADGESKAAWEPDVASVMGTWSAPGDGAAGGDPRWLWRVRRGHRLGVWNHGARTTLHFSQTTQCRGQVPGGTQRGDEQGNEEAADGAGQCHVSSRECPGSEAAFDGLCRAVASANPPSAVATLERDFEQTIAYYALNGVARELIRTTSLLERTNRELRRKFRQVGCFGSSTGAEVAIYIQVKRLNAHWSKQTWWDTARSLYFEFLNLDP